jgi:hypothetical protein
MQKMLVSHPATILVGERLSSRRKTIWTRDEMKRTNPHPEQREVVISDRPMVYR